MDISTYVEEYARKRKYYGLSYNAEIIHNLIKGDREYAFVRQEQYENSEYLAYNIKTSVSRYSRDKDVAIHIYKNFLDFLKNKGVTANVEFPPIDVSNSFERLMFIAKYLQDPRHKISDLSDRLWVSQVTIRSDLRKLRGEDDDPIQICGKVFTIDDFEKRKGSIYFPSTAHPLFLTHNLTQVLVTLKGLKAMAEDPLYAEYARLAAADIWEQLSDYAKTRIHYVLSELLPEDLFWYESLQKKDDDSFYSEVRCGQRNNVLDCIKNNKLFYVEYDGEEGICIYKQCCFVPQSYTGTSIDVNCTSGRICLSLNRIIRTAYTVEELL